LRRHGWPTLGYHFLGRALARSGLERWVELQVHEIIAVPPWRLQLPPRLPHETRVRELNVADLAPLERLRPALGRPYAERFAQAHRALGAFIHERLVAFVWLRRGPSLLPASLGCVWQLMTPMAWVYDLYSDPGVLGAIPHLYAYMRQHPPGEMCEMLVGQTDLDNGASRRAHRRLGYQVRALLWTLRLGPWRVHLSHSRRDGRWRWHRQHGRQLALVPLHLFTAGMALELEPATSPPPAPLPGVRLQCECGTGVALAGKFRCGCGRQLGERRGGVAVVGSSIGYWGELPQAQMRLLLERAEHAGWRQALEAFAPPEIRAYVADRGRASFQDVLPLDARARVLDVGAGWGGIAAELARRYDVTALEGVAERAEFIALRARQDGLTRLNVIQGDLHRVPLAPHQFDLIVANGVLEWVALHDLTAPPAAVQLTFLRRLLDLLAPGGRIYLGIENRLGWAELRGALDHSGLPYTSLLPRFLARWVCAHSPSYRSNFNAGYRTYTYSHRGYARLFRQVGLTIENTWIATAGYNRPTKMIPLDDAAIRFALGAQPATRPGWRPRLRAELKRWLARAWVWRWIGSDFTFVLKPEPAAVAAPIAARDAQHA
jgi:SAM-dependent methyltransferase